MRRLARLASVTALAGCASMGQGSAPPAPVSFVHSTSEAQVTRVVDVREGLSRPQAMRILTEALGASFTVEVVDPRAGFAMTAWQASLQHEGVPDLRYRTRITARFIGDDWRHLQVRDEANWQRGEEWDVGYDAAQLDSVTADLRTRFARKTASGPMPHLR